MQPLERRGRRVNVSRRQALEAGISCAQGTGRAHEKAAEAGSGDIQSARRQHDWGGGAHDVDGIRVQKEVR
jgi:hypothetical protein